MIKDINTWNMDRKVLKYAFAAGIATGIIAAAIILFTADRNKDSVPGPEETVEAFCRAITAGDFETAEQFCDTVSMKMYIDSHKEAWEVLQKEDSDILAIASDILSGTVIQTVSTEKDGDRRNIIYTLEADGNRKERKAVLRREEKKWKIERITDRN